jgi:SOS-response transcriptional repressor LexA
MNQEKTIREDQGSVLAQNIKHLISMESITANELAKSVNIPAATMHKIITGKTTDPRVSTLKLISSFFDVSIDALTSENIEAFDNKTISVCSMPVVGWRDCIKDSFVQNLSPKNWKHWVSVEGNKNSGDFALKSKKSMSPRYPYGTIFVVKKDVSPLDGDLVIVFFKGSVEASIRQLRIDGNRSELISINNASTVDSCQGVAVVGVVMQTKLSVFRDDQYE